jgi:hypothetical protein
MTLFFVLVHMKALGPITKKVLSFLHWVLRQKKFCHFLSLTITAHQTLDSQNLDHIGHGTFFGTRLNKISNLQLHFYFYFLKILS